MFDRSAVRLLADRKRLNHLRRTLHRDVMEFVVDVETDPDRRALLADPFESMADVRDRLEALETSLLEASDRRAVFLTVYTEMTAETMREIDAGVFLDPEWMERYLVRFAEYYRRAFNAYGRGAFAEVPDPWIVAFGTALRDNALVMQDLLLGINAHINYDLALTLSDIGLDPDRSDKRADHDRINEILRRLVSVQQELLSERYAPGLSRVGERLGELDDLTAAISLRTAREKAWQVAVVRSDTRWFPADRYSKWLLNRTATGGAYLLVHPKTSPRTMQVLRDIEMDTLDLPSYAQTYHERVRGH